MKEGKPLNVLLGLLTVSFIGLLECLDDGGGSCVVRCSTSVVLHTRCSSRTPPLPLDVRSAFRIRDAHPTLLNSTSPSGFAPLGPSLVVLSDLFMRCQTPVVLQRSSSH